MTRFERTLIAALAWFGACTGALKGQERLITLVWYQPMLDELGMLADTATVEHIRCGLGMLRGDTLYLMAAWAPKMAQQTVVTANPAEPCPPVLTWFDWHNHLGRDYTILGQVRGTRPAAEYCELSPIDRRAERRPDAPVIQMISVNKDVSCAWVLVNGRYERMTDWPPLPAGP